MTSLFTPTNQELFQIPTRDEDPHDKRMAHLITRFEGSFENFLSGIQENDVVLLGYPDDRGVERNGGRTGAFAAPDQIRKYLFKFTPSYQVKKVPKIWDLGNLKTWSQDLLISHEEARSCVAQIRKRKARIITLGGGHDWAYSDFVDFSEAFSSPARIINVDAHLDVRPNPKDEARAGHSGTPFRRILESANPVKVPEILALGLQESCNSQAHVEWAQSRKMSTLFLDELPANLEHRWPFVMDRLFINDPKIQYGLSIDLDAFPQFISPGVSAPQVTGVNPYLIQSLLKSISPQIQHLGIYECNPNYDVDGQSARLAARLIYDYLMNLKV